MTVAYHRASKDIYFTSKKVASTLLNKLPFERCAWHNFLSPRQYADYDWYFITRDPADRFLSCYNHMYLIYSQGHAWDFDETYRTALSTDEYEKFFIRADWHNLNTMIDFVHTVLPKLSESKDPHWHSQTRTIETFELINYTCLHLNNLSYWFYTKYGWKVKPLNNNPWYLSVSKQACALALDPLLKQGPWKLDYAMCQS